MKKTSISTIAIAAAAMAFTFASCTGSGSKIEKNSTDSTATATATDVQSDSKLPVLKPERGGVVFIRIDSVINSYDMYHDLRTQFEEEATKKDSNLQAKGKAFERDAKNFQERYQKGLITQSQAQEESERLQRRQDALMKEQNEARASLAEKENVLLNQIQDAVLKYVNTYNEAKGYSMIISTSGNSTVLYGNPGLDITKEVIDGLNEEYIKNKPATK